MRSTRPNHTVPTWAIYLFAAALVAVGIAALAVVRDVSTYDLEPGPAATSPDRPEPSPSTSTVTPAPRPQPEAKPRPQPAPMWPGFPEPSQPVKLVIDPTIDPYWNVDEAAEKWNRVTGCRLFTVTYDGKAEPAPGGVYRVREQADLTHDGDTVRGLFGRWNDATDEYEILLNPAPGPHPTIAMHELGHAIGLGHYRAAGVMSDRVFGDDNPSAAEIAQARTLNPKRCGS